MREIATFLELYDICISILEEQNELFINFINIEKINYIRNNYDKNLLNSYFVLGNISQIIANSIEAKSSIVKFSVDSLVKNIIEHPEVSIAEYEQITKYLDNAEYIF